jgi:O-methyltransferase involved in polyketide biosynthesis
VEKGTRQYVLIGAGFDSFALRRPAFSLDVEIFEIDHPATQTLKLERIKECDRPEHGGRLSDVTYALVPVSAVKAASESM